MRVEKTVDDAVSVFLDAVADLPAEEYGSVAAARIGVAAVLASMGAREAALREACERARLALRQDVLLDENGEPYRRPARKPLALAMGMKRRERPWHHPNPCAIIAES